jgi:hypothetical protein
VDNVAVHSHCMPLNVMAEFNKYSYADILENLTVSVHKP